MKYVGNSSLLGAHLVLLSQAARESAGEIARSMTYLELSTNPGFMDNYVSALFLPHTDQKLFPSVLQRVGGGGRGAGARGLKREEK